MKICPKCKLEKELDCFWKSCSYCKPCYNAHKREQRQKNKSELAERRKVLWRRSKSRFCKKCKEPFVGKGRIRDYCSTKCKILHHVIKKRNGCWEWKGDLHPNGYGYTTIHEIGKRIHVHRTSYIIFKGDIPQGLYVCHSCDNPKCCNPDHLWVGTAKENMQDAKRKGRLRNQYGRVSAS